MSAYTPSGPAMVGLLGALLAGTLLAGFVIGRLPPGAWARGAAWLLVVGSTASTERLSAPEPAGVRMLAIIGALLFGMKAVVTVEVRADGGPTLRAWQWFAFATFWPGMRPSLFATAGEKPLAGARDLLRRGAVRLLTGAACIGGAWGLWQGREVVPEPVVLVPATALLLAGISLMFHFGVFNLLAGAWRLAGVDVRPLFRAPLAARSLSDFWGRRWNLAFSEMTALGVYRPLAGRLGKGTATGAAFLCSGLLHELAISVPVRAGFGLPLAYFALHGLLVMGERWLERTGRAVTGWGWRSHVWVIGWLALPLPILFHPPFLRGVVWPLIGMAPGE